MEPIPETREAVDEFGPFSDDGDLVTVLQRKAEAVRRLVPDLVGLSVAATAEDATFTLVASDDDVAALDALQYLDDGPCLQAGRAGAVVAADHAYPSEESWHLFALGTAAAGVASTLTLPVREGERVVGTVNLYAASPGAFAGHHEAIAEVFGAWAEGAVTNADLAFRTREDAEDTPARLRGVVRVELAAGLLAGSAAMPIERAHQRLEEAARRAGVPVAELAEVVIEALSQRG